MMLHNHHSQQDNGSSSSSTTTMDIQVEADHAAGHGASSRPEMLRFRSWSNNSSIKSPRWHFQTKSPRRSNRDGTYYYSPPFHQQHQQHLLQNSSSSHHAMGLKKEGQQQVMHQSQFPTSSPRFVYDDKYTNERSSDRAGHHQLHHRCCKNKNNPHESVSRRNAHKPVRQKSMEKLYVSSSSSSSSGNLTLVEATVMNARLKRKQQQQQRQ